MFRKKIVALLLVVGLLASFWVIANAESSERSEPNGNNFVAERERVDDPVGPTRMAYISSYHVALLISGSGVATCTSSLTGYSGTTTKVTITIYLEKKGFLGLYWSDVTSWSQTFNDYRGTLSKDYTVGKGTYRTRTVFTAYKGSASETVTAYSSQVKY